MALYAVEMFGSYSGHMCIVRAPDQKTAEKIAVRKVGDCDYWHVERVVEIGNDGRSEVLYEYHWEE